MLFVTDAAYGFPLARWLSAERRRMAAFSYILGSPSLWFDRGVMFDREKDYARAHKDMPASVFFGIGGRETLAAGKKRSRSEEDADMLADLREFDAALKSHRYPGLTTRLEVFVDEDHASVFPLVLTHGLRAYLKKLR